MVRVVAEHVIALIFALAMKIPQAARLQQKRNLGQDAIWNDAPGRARSRAPRWD